MTSSSASRDPQEWWRDRSVLITGHTGFKGAWLALWLQAVGARVAGIAHGTPTKPSLYELARVGEHMDGELQVDVRDGPAVQKALRAIRPEIVMHLAAQPMVRLSLREPQMTYAINVMGTVNVLEGVRTAGESVRAVVVVTSDKCYANPSAYGAGRWSDGDDEHRGSDRERARRGSGREREAGPGSDRECGAGPGREREARRESGRDREVHRFVETDPLGGHDPYSSSKACAELVTDAYRESYFAGDGPNVASARAGNVIGGGDFGEDRLVPDVLRAYARGVPVRVRNPGAIRPWQHVLNPLSGYLTLARTLCEPDGSRAARAFNFGPKPEDARTVREIVERLDEILASGRSGERATGAPIERRRGYELDQAVHPPEAMRLELDSGAAECELGWGPRWDLDEALARVAAWHLAYQCGKDVRDVGLEQIAAFVCSK